MSETTTVGWKHPYPTFYWEHRPSGGAWQDAINLSGYASGQGTDSLTLDSATNQEAGHLRCKLNNPAGDVVYTREAALTGDTPLTFTTHPRNLTLSTSIAFTTQPQNLTITATGGER